MGLSVYSVGMWQISVKWGGRNTGKRSCRSAAVDVTANVEIRREKLCRKNQEPASKSKRFSASFRTAITMEDRLLLYSHICALE